MIELYGWYGNLSVIEQVGDKWKCLCANCGTTKILSEEEIYKGCSCGLYGRTSLVDARRVIGRLPRAKKPQVKKPEVDTTIEKLLSQIEKLEEMYVHSQSEKKQDI